MTSSKELSMPQILIYRTSTSDRKWPNGALFKFQTLGFYFINSPLRAVFQDFHIKPPSQILPPIQYPLTYMKKPAKRLYRTVRGLRKCPWDIPAVADLAEHPNEKSMVVFLWDGGSTFLSK